MATGKKDKKVYRINVLVFVVLPNNDSDYEDFTFYIRASDKHNAVFQLMKDDVIDFLLYQHNQLVYDKKMSLDNLWESIINYEFVDLLSVKVW